MNISQRTQNLIAAQEIAKNNHGCSIPAFRELPSDLFESVQPPTGILLDVDVSTTPHDRPGEFLVSHYFQQLQNLGISSHIERVVEPMLQEFPIMMRCAPLTPESHNHLSYAGTYPSFIPKPFPQDIDSVNRAAASVLAGKHTKYAEYYHKRHAIPDTQRKLGILVMELIKDPAMHGTAYSFSNNVRTEYVFDPNVSEDTYDAQYGAQHLVDDKFGISSNAGSSEFCKEINFDQRLTNLLRAVESKFNHPVDVEYLVDTEGHINIVQVRPISKKHLDNWTRYYSQSSQDIDTSASVVRRAILNSVGTIPVDMPIKNIHHADTFHVLSELDETKEPSLLVEHPDDRIRDHLQYSALEDPYIVNLYHADHESAQMIINRRSDTYSNGDTYYS